MEVHRNNDLHYLIDEMERWRGIIGDNYTVHKRSELTHYRQ
jgi:hypothetical protein